MKQFYFLTFLTFLFFGQNNFGQCEWDNNFTQFIPTSDGAILVGDPNPQVDGNIYVVEYSTDPFSPGNAGSVPFVTFNNDDLADDGQYELTGLEPGTLYYITIFIFCLDVGVTSTLQNPVNFVTLDSACPDPENLTFDPTSEGFDIIGSPSELYSSYTVEVYGDNNALIQIYTFTNDDLVDGVYSATGLDPLTSYTALFYATCTDGSNSASQENIFETLVNIDCPDIYYAPYYNDFGSVNETGQNVSAVDIATFEQCNILIDADEQVPETLNADRWGVFLDFNNPGNVFAVSFAVDPNNFEQTNPDQLFVIGPFDFTNETNIELGWEVTNVSNSPDTYSVYVSETSEYDEIVTSSLSYSETLSADYDGVWQPRSLDISEAAGGLRYISFRHHNSPQGFVMGIDNVTVGSCPMPQINFWQMGDNGVQFGGINNDQILGYQIEYSTSEFVPGDGSANVYEFDSFPGSLDGLETDTQYYFAIRSICGDGNYSAWEGDPDPWSTTGGYCEPVPANCSFGDGFLSFDLADISNPNSGCSPDGYGDFSDQSTDLEQGATYTFTMVTGWDEQNVSMWIDFNDDAVFSSNELILTDEIVNITGEPVEIEVTIPADATLGEHRLRAKSDWQQNSSDNPCQAAEYGETEDYTVNIVEALSTSNFNILNLKIFPNPADTDFVTITSSVSGDKLIEVLDMNGRKMISTIITDDKLNISSLETGFYMTKVTIDGKTSTSKLIIE